MEPQGQRLPWEDVPATVQDAVAALLGSPVVSAVNQPGGFSPGVAARCGLADGRRVFLKVVSSDQNPMAPMLHRREARVSAALPPGLPVPQLLGVMDDGHWVAVAFEEIDGHPPALPWSMEDLGHTFEALDALTAATTPCAVEGLLPFSQRHAESFRGYRRLAGDEEPPGDIDDWSRRHLTRLADLESEWEPAADGAALLHSDLRADNLLVRPDGSVVIVDWPHACVGAAWVDKACMLPSVGLDGGPAPTDVEAALSPLRDAEPEAVDRVLVGLAGYFTYQGAQPDPPGLPTVRAFQRVQGEVTRTWLAHRLRLA